MAVSVLQRSGVLQKGSSTKLTEKGKKRQAMGRSRRAKSRAVVKANKSRKGKTRSSRQYTYNKKTNRAVLKKKKSARKKTSKKK